MIQGTIAAAAVINEIIAVYMAKKGLSGPESFSRPAKREKQEAEQHDGTEERQPAAQKEKESAGGASAVPSALFLCAAGMTLWF